MTGMRVAVQSSAQVALLFDLVEREAPILVVARELGIPYGTAQWRVRELRKRLGMPGMPPLGKKRSK